VIAYINNPTHVGVRVVVLDAWHDATGTSDPWGNDGILVLGGSTVEELEAQVDALTLRLRQLREWTRQAMLAAWVALRATKPAAPKQASTECRTARVCAVSEQWRARP
jgi:hypothetical protein